MTARMTWLATAGSLLAIACGGRSTEPPQHVVLVTVDTLRADRLGTYGWRKPTSPGIDAIASESTVFETAVPTCPATGPSVASILTGAHRSTHRVFGNGWRLPADVETLAETLHAKGFHTVGRVANLTVDADAGFAQGFDDFAVPAGLARGGPAMLEGEPLVADAVRLIEAVDRPTFLWLHLMDPHGPYFPPDDYRRRFDPADYVWPGDAPLPLGTTNFGLHLIPAYQIVAGETDPARYRARYDAEIRYTDDHVSAIVAALRTRGLWDRTLFVLTADHGEALGEHDYWFAHGWFVSDDQLRVPLIVHGGGFPAGRRVGASVSLVDVAPTILDAVGLPPRRRWKDVRCARSSPGLGPATAPIATRSRRRTTARAWSRSAPAGSSTSSSRRSRHRAAPGRPPILSCPRSRSSGSSTSPRIPPRRRTSCRRIRTSPRCARACRRGSRSRRRSGAGRPRSSHARTRRRCASSATRSSSAS
jgi:arylsulfatase A-like enzyme